MYLTDLDNFTQHYKHKYGRQTVAARKSMPTKFKILRQAGMGFVQVYAEWDGCYKKGIYKLKVV